MELVDCGDEFDANTIILSSSSVGRYKIDMRGMWVGRESSSKKRGSTEEAFGFSNLKSSLLNFLVELGVVFIVLELEFVVGSACSRPSHW